MSEAEKTWKKLSEKEKDNCVLKSLKEQAKDRLEISMSDEPMDSKWVPLAVAKAELEKRDKEIQKLKTQRDVYRDGEIRQREIAKVAIQKLQELEGQVAKAQKILDEKLHVIEINYDTYYKSDVDSLLERLRATLGGEQKSE